MDEDNQITLQSSDRTNFQVEVKVAKMSETVKQLIEDAGIDNTVPLPNVTGKILAKVVEYCKYHCDNVTIVTEGTDDIIAWDLEFTKVDQATLFEIILAANYLDIKDLLDLTCKTVARMIKGKTRDEIKKTFNITVDFTEEEEMQVRKENEWSEER